MESLLSELLLTVFDFLDLITIIEIREVGKRWRTLIDQRYSNKDLQIILKNKDMIIQTSLMNNTYRSVLGDDSVKNECIEFNLLIDEFISKKDFTQYNLSLDIENNKHALYQMFDGEFIHSLFRLLKEESIFSIKIKHNEINLLRFLFAVSNHLQTNCFEELSENE